MSCISREERNVLTTRTRMRILKSLHAETPVNTPGPDIEKQKELREKTQAEIISSEESYLHQLDILIKYFMEPLERDSLMSVREYNALFGQLRNIKSLNEELLEQLKKNQENMGAAFLEMAPFLKLYSTYANNFQQTITIIQRLEKESQIFAEFLQKQELRSEVATKLNALLITPVQRIPRYKLLLEQLLEYTPFNTQSYDLLKEAVDTISMVAKYINECIREHETIQKMLGIQRSLVGGQPRIMLPGRRLIRDGSLMKVSRKGDVSHPRIFLLFSDMLMYCKPRNSDYSKPNSLVCSCILPINHVRVESLLGNGQQKGALFKVTCKDEVLVLYSDDPVEGQAWITALQSAISQHSQFRQTLRKESSGKRPIRRAAIVKLREESLTQLRRRRPAKETEQEQTPASPSERRYHDALHPLRELARLQECITPRKKLRPNTLALENGDEKWRQPATERESDSDCDLSSILDPVAIDELEDMLVLG